MNKPFVFKEFTIKQDQCAMKIGTDSVLLGAITSLSKKPYSILDIGAGTGVLALMLAQRSDAEIIDALEIDADAYEQCVDNFEQSPWGDRLFCYHASIQEFAEEIEDTYDLIVCNPPFYSEDYKTNDASRDLARFQDAMPFEHLIQAVTTLLNQDGKFSVIIPFKAREAFIHLAEKVNLNPEKITKIRGHKASEFKRVVIEFSYKKTAHTTSELTIEHDRHEYTNEYISLTKDFYLKM